jgi:soluble cytochrome b562
MSFPQLPGSRPNTSPQKKPLAKKVEQSVLESRGTKSIEGKLENLPVEMQPLPTLEKSFFASQEIQLISSTESQGSQKAKSTPAIAKTDKVASPNSNALNEYRNELYSTAREIEAYYQKGELSKADRDLLISTIIKTLQELAKAELDPYEAWGNHEKNISEENRKTFRFLTKSTRSLINETAKLAQSGELEEALKIFKNLEGMNSLKNDRDKYLGQGRDWGDWKCLCGSAG